MKPPEITVVIPAYNAGKYLADSIMSVNNQLFTDWELIIVDDGSTDNTANIAQKFLVDNKIMLIKQVNKGVSAARNAGIRAAKGRFITFLDMDDCYLPDNLLKKYNALNNNEKIDFVYCDIMQCDEKMNEVRVERGVDSENLFNKVMQWQKETIPTLPSNIMVKTALMKEKFLWDENLSNCADRYMKIMLSQHNVGSYIPEALVKYRNSPNSMSKKVWLLEHDELYIADKIVNESILPPGKLRRKVIANMYSIVSGSWYRDAHKPLRALKFGLKAAFIYPPAIFMLMGKLTGLINNKIT